MLLRDSAALKDARSQLRPDEFEQVEELGATVLSLLLPRYFGVRTTVALIGQFVDEVASTFPQDRALPRDQAVELVLYLLHGQEPAQEHDPLRTIQSAMQMLSTAARQLHLEDDREEVERLLARAETHMAAEGGQ